MTDYEKNHRELWRWLKNGKEKRDWPRWSHNGGDVRRDLFPNDCFACAYAYSKALTIDCDKCPIDWGIKELPNHGKGKCETDGSLYKQWVDMSECGATSEQRGEVAALIAELPWTDT